ncbi:MAG: glycosyltransferase [Campylobacterales bacterium]
MKILFTTPILEHPPAGGPQLRIANSIKALAKCSELHIISRASLLQIGGDNAEIFFRQFCNNFEYSPSVVNFSSNKYLHKIQRLVMRVLDYARQDDRYISQLLVRVYDYIDADANFIIEYCKKHDINIIWFGYGNISFHLMKKIKVLAPEVKIVCDTDSVWSRFVLRELPYEKDPIRAAKIKRNGLRKEREEKEWVDLCDVTTAVSEVDAEYYKSIASNKDKIHIFSNVIDLQTYATKPPKPANFKNPSVYLAGSFGPKSAMDKAARWFIDDIFPLLQKQIPNIHFYIVGSGSKETLSDIKNPQIEVLGKMPSVLPYLCNSDVSIVPLQFESGTRFKIMEAAACCVPIVSTTLGAEGIPLEHGRDILIADEPGSFANSIVELINNKEYAANMAQKCFVLIEKNNSVESLAQEAKNILKKLA